MNRVGKFVLGCLFSVIGLIVLGLLFFAGLRAAGVPDPRVTERTLEQPLRDAPALESRSRDQTGEFDDGVRPPKFDGAAPVRVVIDMREGYFIIVPGPAHEGIKVDAHYDEATYELTQKYDLEGKQPSYALKFKSNVNWMRRLAQGEFDSEENENEIRVQLPLDTPMDLYLSLAMSESEIDLSGLALTNLSTKFRMGEFDFHVDEENPIAMETFEVDCSMGEFRMQGLSRLNPGRIKAKGSMAELTLDLDGVLTRHTEISARMQMGEMTLKLPENALWDPHGSVSATMGEVNGRLENPRPPSDVETAPVLSVNGRVFMGEMHIDSYPVRSTVRGRDRH